MTSFDHWQPKTIHIHEHEIRSPKDWPEAVEELVEVLKLRAYDSVFPTLPPTVGISENIHSK